MRVLVIGASGFLGAHTYLLLKTTDGIDATGAYGRRAILPDMCQVDLASGEVVGSLIREIDPDVVIWCAKHTCAATTGTESEINTIGLRAVLAHARRDVRIIFVSTDGLLSGTQGHYDEKAVTVPIEADSGVAVYTNAKLNAEQYLRDNWDNYCVVRVGPIYGRSIFEEWDPRIAALTAAFARGETVLRATNIKRTFIDVRDLAHALCELVKHPYKGILHLGPLESLNHFEFACTVADMNGFSS